MSDFELIPCIKCGKHPTIVEAPVMRKDGKIFENTYIECSTCNIIVRSSVFSGSKEKYAMINWNHLNKPVTQGTHQ